MKKRNNKKGFTLAELLIVVAIIAVLTAIAIPVFSTQLHKSKDAADLANIRSYYADLQSEALTNGTSSSKEASSTQSIALSDGEGITLNNLKFTVSIVGDAYAIDWECTSENCPSAEHSGHFGPTATP